MNACQGAAKEPKILKHSTFLIDDSKITSNLPNTPKNPQLYAAVLANLAFAYDLEVKV